MRGNNFTSSTTLSTTVKHKLCKPPSLLSATQQDQHGMILGVKLTSSNVSLLPWATERQSLSESLRAVAAGWTWAEKRSEQLYHWKIYIYFPLQIIIIYLHASWNNGRLASSPYTQNCQYKVSCNIVIIPRVFVVVIFFNRVMHPVDLHSIG